MKLCCCVGTNIERIELASKAGYKYCEIAFTDLAVKTDEDFAALKDKMGSLGIKPIAANCMFSPRMRLLEGEKGYPAVREHLEKALPRAKELGIPVVILGSGDARKIPEGMTKQEAADRFVAVIKDVIAPMFAEYGIMIGLEELRAEECNFINTCKEAMEIIRRIDRPNVKLLLDFYHAILGGDTLEELETYGTEYIVHVHYGSPINERRAPKHGVDDHLIREYFALLKKMGYDEGFSLEGKTDDFEAEITEALSVMTAEL